MSVAVVTGGSGFLGRLLVSHLLDYGWQVRNIDLEPLEIQHPGLVSVQGDIRKPADMEKVFAGAQVDVVFHCAAQLAHASIDKDLLWSSNVTGAELVADFAQRYKISKIVYISSNCLWGESLGRPVREDDTPHPAEIYGLSKWEAEKILLARQAQFDSVIFRCPTIIDAGRLGLLSILFEFIEEGRRVWVVGDGTNQYQFIYAQDLIDAMVLAASHQGTDVFGIGSDNPGSLKDTYDYVIRQSGSKARVAHLPKAPTIWAMKLAYFLKLSPLGPYHYRMIASDFVFDTQKLKRVLGWSPKVTNDQMLYKAYEYYIANKAEIRARGSVSAHRKVTKLGIIRLLKWMS